MSRKLPWRQIEELPDDVSRILAFVPDHFDTKGRQAFDHRCCIVERVPRGWWFEHHQGGYFVEPTHFILIFPPDGFPTAPA